MDPMIFKNLLQKLFNPVSPNTASNPDFPKEGILWREWNDGTQKLIAERNRPVLFFVANPNPAVWPFLKAVLGAMPSNPKLRELLHDYYIAVMIKGDSIPEYFRDLGAGSRYNIAILSPAGLTPMTVINPISGIPREIVTTITKILEKLQEIY